MDEKNSLFLQFWSTEELDFETEDGWGVLWMGKTKGSYGQYVPVHEGGGIL